MKKTNRKFAYGDGSIGVQELCGDCGLCGHGVVESGHADPRPGADVKLVPGQKNIFCSVVIPAPKIVFKEAPPAQTPEEVLQRSKEILESIEYPDANPLTVGDLSGLRNKQRKKDLAWRSKAFNIDNDKMASVGDLSVLETSEKDLDELYQGPTVPQPSTSEVQEFEAKRIRLAKEKQAEAMKIRELLFQEEQAKEARRQARSQGLSL